MSVMAATTSHSASYLHRSYPLATSTGDASYSPAMLERLRRPDSYSRHPPPLSHARTSEYTSTSHGRTRSYVYERAGTPAYAESSSESPSPREARSSLPQTTASTMQSTSISFATTISATSTWAMSPSAYSSSPSSTSSSSPVSRARTQHHQRAIEPERGGAASRRDREPFPEVAQRWPLLDSLPSRPAPQAQAVHVHVHDHDHTFPRASISPDRSRAASPLGSFLPTAPSPSFTAEQRHAYRHRERERERERERQDSWSPDSARQALPPMWDPRPSRGPSPEFVQGSSSFSSRAGAGRRWAPPPPPSPSPSTSSYSASGRTDTDPTDEDEQLQQQPVKVEQDQHEGVTLPSFRSAFPSAPPMWHSLSESQSQSQSHPHTHAPVSWTRTSPVHPCRDALSPLSSRSAAGSPSPSSAEYASAGVGVGAGAGSVWGPRSAVFRHDGAGAGTDDVLPALVSDVRSHMNISHARNEHPTATVSTNASARQQTQWRIHQGSAPTPTSTFASTSTRARPAPLENIPPVGTVLAELPVMSPTPKKYRFVTSKPAEMQYAEEDLEARRRPVTVSPSGTKRRYPGASSESSIDVPLTPPETPEDEGDCGAPRKRRQGQGQSQNQSDQQLPYESSFPAAESGAAAGATAGGKFGRSARGAIVPAYHYDTERALKCAFPGCGAVLTGKKSETASHMRSHFLQAVGETLECPWPADGGSVDDGSGNGGRGRCGMAFKDSANFGRHVSSKHIRAEEYQCNRCGRPFARRDAALRHMKTLCRTDGAGTRRKNEKKTKGRTEDYEEVHMFND